MMIEFDSRAAEDRATLLNVCICFKYDYNRKFSLVSNNNNKNNCMENVVLETSLSNLWYLVVDTRVLKIELTRHLRMSHCTICQ